MVVQRLCLFLSPGGPRSSRLPPNKGLTPGRHAVCLCVGVIKWALSYKSCWLRFLHKSRRSKTDLHHPISFHLHLKNSLTEPIFQMQEPHPPPFLCANSIRCPDTQGAHLFVTHKAFPPQRSSSSSKRTWNSPSVHFRCKKKACG